MKDYLSQNRGYDSHPSSEPGSGLERSQAARPLTLSRPGLRRQLRDLATLTVVSLVLNSTFELEEVVRIIVSAVIQVIGCQAAAIFDLDPASAELSLRLSHGLSRGFVEEVRSASIDSRRVEGIRTGETLAVSDVTADSFFAELGAVTEGAEIRAFVDLPLIVRDLVIGCLSVYFAEPHAFSDFELEMLSIFANQVASALHHARLYDWLERRMQELSGLAEMEQVMTTSLHLDRLLPGLAEGLCRVLDATGGVLFLWDAHQKRGELAAAIGLAPHISRLAEDEPDTFLLVAETVARREPVVVGDVTACSLVGQRLANQLDFKTLVGLPLMTGGKVLGVMVLGDPHWVEQESSERAMLVARQVALAIANALLFEETSRQARDVMALSRAARAVASLGTLDGVLEQLLEELSHIVSADLSAIYLCTGEGGDVPVLKASRGQLLEDGIGLENPAAKSLLGWVLQQKRTLLLPGPQGSELGPPGLAEGASGSLFYVPILFEDRCLGVIVLEDRQANAFGAREQSLVASFADHAAMAIENVRRYDAVLQERNLIQTIVAGMADGMVVTDTEDNVMMCNRAAREMLGVETGQGWTLEQAMPEPGEGTKSLARVHGSGLVGGQWQTTLERLGRMLSVGMTPLLSGEGESRGSVYVIRDLTKWAELDQAKSDFISQVSHDLRAPLATVKTLVGLLRTGKQTVDKQREYLDIIESEVDRQAQLVNDLLEMGRLEAGEVDWTVGEVSMNDVVEQAMRACLSLAGEKHIEFSARPISKLPKIMGTHRRLQQVLINLLTNAIKYTPAGGRVTVEADSDETTVWVAVSDTGPGIPKSALPYVFDKFYRVRQGSRKHEGTGLGLAIAREIVEALDGTIEVESQVGRGSCFTVRLPRARAIVEAMRKRWREQSAGHSDSTDR